MFYKTSVAKFVKNYTKISYYSHKRFSNINKFSREITQKKNGELLKQCCILLV